VRRHPAATAADASRPQASPWQQTLNRSFCIGGIGLHLAEYGACRDTRCEAAKRVAAT